MQDFLIDYYLSLKAVHIIAVISWMAGLLYLPRLFVYHWRVGVMSDPYRLFCLMEGRLLRIIMAPAAVVVGVTGWALWAIPGVVEKPNGWFHGKILFVLGLFLFHLFLARCAHLFRAGFPCYSEKFFRIINEVPTLFMILIVFFVVLKPF